MRNFQLIAKGIDVLPILHAIQRQPRLWNQCAIRTTFPNSPHKDVSDVLLRFEKITCESTDPHLDEKLEASERIWQDAWFKLPQVRLVLLDLMRRVEAYELARVVLTRLPPGKTIPLHADVKGTYASLPDIARYHIVLQGLPGSLFKCGDETINPLTGEIWWFNASLPHEVVNNSADDRLHLLVDVRVMP